MSDALDKQSVGLDKHIERLEAWRNKKAEARAEGSTRSARARAFTEKVITRITYGVIYALVTIASFMLGRIPTLVVICLMAWLCCSEFFRLTRLSGRMPNEILGLAFALLFPVATHFDGIDAMMLVSFALIVGCGVWFVFTPRANLADVAITIFGPVYTSMTLSSLILLRATGSGSDGAFLALGAFVSIWANDSFAYFFGSRFGKHPLAPRISPHKSWEGFIAGMLAGVLVWLVMGISHLCGISLGLSILTGVLTSFMGVCGDLFESRLKRGVGVKDSGNIMPGHGGLLDRSDSILFGCLTAYFILHFGGIC